MREDALANALSGSGVRVVVLSACESSKTAPASEALANGLAQRISAQGIAYVIGMRESIIDEAAIQFEHTLCDELAHGERIDFALQAARVAMQSLVFGAGQASAAEELGQWCLPLLIANDTRQQVIDWRFDPTPPAVVQQVGNALGAVHLPARFIGRRSEMRQYKKRLQAGGGRNLLITGAGGQGKTSLAGKIALDMQARGWRVFAYSARWDEPWQGFLFEELQMALDAGNSKQYDQFLAQARDETERAHCLFKLLLQQFDGRVILFLDSLETLQDPATHALTDHLLATWFAVACVTPSLQVLATSRWLLPDWDGEHHSLMRANYGDFLQMALRLPLPEVLWDWHQMREVYQLLGGNSRGLVFFTATMQQMSDAAIELAFWDKLRQTQAELQADMAIEAIVNHLPDTARHLLRRLPNFTEPVPIEGIAVLGIDLPEPEAAVQALLAVSLLEVSDNFEWQVKQYECLPLVVDWLQQRSEIDEAEVHLNMVANYHLYLLMGERDTLAQAIAAHDALRRAGRDKEADLLTLNKIVGPMSLAGSYTNLLADWLPNICDSGDDQIRVKALASTGNLNFHLGDYETALVFMKQALAMCQQMGDKAGECDTLNNIGLGYHAQGDYEAALVHLKRALSIREQIGYQSAPSTILNNIAATYYAKGDYETALANVKQALAIQQQSSAKSAEAATLNNIAVIYISQDNYEMALVYLKQALTISQQSGDKSVESTTLNNISQIYRAQSEQETALVYLTQALLIYKQSGNKAGVGTVLNNISQIYDTQGDYETALSYLKQALLINQQIGNKAVEAITLNNVATIWLAQGNYEMALVYIKQALTISQQIGAKADEATVLNNISRIYTKQGETEMALIYMKQALAAQRQIGDSEGEITTLNNIAVNYYGQADCKAALAYLRQALVIRQKTDDKEGECTLLKNISDIYNAQGDYENAMIYIKQVLAIRHQIGDRAELCCNFFNFGTMQCRNGEMLEAINAWVNAYIIGKQINLPEVLQALSKVEQRIFHAGQQLGMTDFFFHGWEQLAQQMSQTDAS